MVDSQDGYRDDPIDSPIYEYAPTSYAVEEIVDLEVAEDDDLRSDASRGSVAGTVVSVIAHVWLLMNLAQMAVEEEPDWYEPPIDSRIVELKDKEEEVETVDYTLANPDDRELEVKEVLNAASIGLALTDKPKKEVEPRPIDELIPQLRERRVYDVPEGTQVDENIVVSKATKLP